MLGRKHPQGVRYIRRAAKLPTGVRWIPPCAKVLPAAKTLVRRKSPAALDGIAPRHGRGGVPCCCLGKFDVFDLAAEAREDGRRKRSGVIFSEKPVSRGFRPHIRRTCRSEADRRQGALLFYFAPRRIPRLRQTLLRVKRYTP